MDGLVCCRFGPPDIKEILAETDTYNLFVSMSAKGLLLN